MHLAAGGRERPRHREADHAGANDNAVGCLHELLLPHNEDFDIALYYGAPGSPGNAGNIGGGTRRCDAA